MGVPSFFRWLSRKYPKIISPVVEAETQWVDGVQLPIDYASPNPNGELDNLYLDMNGIVHPCSHPENRPAPETEDEMLLAVFEYTNRVLNMARPRKVLMIAVDGVAPRAKMNQQRARRFRSAQEAKIQAEEKARVIAAKEQMGETIDEAVKAKKTWDSNAITPGTPFMFKLAQSLRYWTAYKLATDPGWADLQIIISDATVPGEGEHKIMNFIRSQRSDPEYNPNTSHCIYGLDADLIFLGLATHEPHFRILREDVFADQGRRMGVRDHLNLTAEQEAVMKEEESRKPFLWLHIGVLREYLAVELSVPRLPFPWVLERAIDDWVFMCFFCGNDFLPHLPSLDVRENSIDTLVGIWKNVLPRLKTYMTCDGELNLEAVEALMGKLGSQEDEVFRQRQQQEKRKEESYKRRRYGNDDFKKQLLSNVTKGKDRNAMNPTENMPIYSVDGTAADGSLALSNSDFVEMRKEMNLANSGDSSAATALIEKSVENMEQANNANFNAAAALRQKLAAKREEPPSETSSDVSEKRKVEEEDDGDDSGDKVRLYEPGYNSRYYKVKFHTDDIEPLKKEVVRCYVEGIAWVLLYYYQGCASWNWYYPYHYAPFAQDFVDISDLQITFTLGKPFLPYEQLMSVLPAASGHNLPAIFRPLMSEEDSPIIDFYPEDFPIDMNGKKMSWQGIVLLPFIDEERLLKVVREQYAQLSEAESARNVQKEAILMISNKNVNYKKFRNLYESDIDVIKFHHFRSSLAGDVLKSDTFSLNDTLYPPVVGGNLPDISCSLFMKLMYKMPPKVHSKAIILNGFIPARPSLTAEDKDAITYHYKTHRYFNMKAQGPVPVGPGGNSQYTLRMGGYKAYLQMSQQQANQALLSNIQRLQNQGQFPQPSTRGGTMGGNYPRPSRNGYL